MIAVATDVIGILLFPFYQKEHQTVVIQMINIKVCYETLEMIQVLQLCSFNSALESCGCAHSAAVLQQPRPNANFV